MNSDTICKQMHRYLLGIGLFMLVFGQAQTPVTFWGAFFNPDEVALLEQLTETFNEQNPDVEVEFVLVPGAETEITRLMTAVAAGEGPDIYYLDRFTTAERAETGLLEDLTPFIETEGISQAELASMYADFAWNESTYEGGVYSLPFDTDARMLFYRRDLLEAAGIDLQQLDPTNGPITPDTYREIAFALNETDESGAYTRLGALPWSDQGWHVTWGFAFGGQFTDGVCEVTPTNEGVMDGYQFLYDFAEALEPARASAFESTYIPRGQPPQQHPFLQGRLAMTISGTFFDDTIRDVAPDLDYGITYIPSATGEPFSWSGGFSLAIPAGAENPEAAYRFIRFATSELGQRVWAGETGRMPTLESLLADASVLGVNAAFYDDLLEVSRERFALPVAARYWDELTAAQEAVVLNDQTAESALERVLSRVQPRLDRLCSQ